MGGRLHRALGMEEGLVKTRKICPTCGHRLTSAERILAALQNASLGPAEIADATELSTNVVSVTLGRLLARGQVSHSRWGRWTTT